MSLIRDFTDEKKQELATLIREEEELTKDRRFFDWISDPFIRGKIEQSDDDIELYHKKILDKKDTSIEQLNEIFDKVYGIEDEFSPKLKVHSENLGDLEKCFAALAEMFNPNPADGGDFVFARPASEFSNYLQVGSVVYNQTIRKLTIYDKYGNIIDYNWEAINALMLKDVESVQPEVFSALSDIFDQMTIRQKEKFIEVSYVLDTPGDNHDNPLDKYIISPVFQKLAVLYQYKIRCADWSNVDLDNVDDPMHEALFNAALLLAFSTSHATLYTNAPMDISINPYTLEDGTRKKWDYEISTNALFDPWVPGMPWEKSPETFHIYQYREDFDQMFDDKVATKILQNVDPEFGLGFSIGKAFIMSYLGAFSSADMLFNLASDYEKNVSDQKSAQVMVSLLDAGNLSRALYWGGTVIMLSDGTYVLVNTTVDESELNMAQRAYARATGNKSYSAEEIESAIKNGTLDKLKIDDYYKWYYEGNRKSAVENYAKGLNNACEQKYGPNKKPENLTYNEMMTLEKEYPELFGG